MTSTAEPVFVPGVWGPYYSAMVPGMWLNEGAKPVLAPAAEEPVLLGSAILGSVAAGAFSDVRSAMGALTSVASVYTPRGQDVGETHERRYQAFLSLQDVSRTIQPL